MDLERLKKVQAARSEYVEAANADLPEAEGSAEQLIERFRSVAEIMAKYVAHKHYECLPGEYHRRHKSASRHVGTFKGPMPEVRVRFNYSYDLKDTDPYAERGGVGFNQHDENIKSIVVEWIHVAEGISAEPSNLSTNDVPAITEYGEVFATEFIHFSELQILSEHVLDSFMGSDPSIRLALIEQSMGQYEAALPSTYELREGLVQI